MYHRVACSLRENPSKVQHFQAGINKKDKSEKEEIAEVKQTKKRQISRELRFKPSTVLSCFSWKPEKDISLEKQPFFDNRKQSVSRPEPLHFQPTYTEPLKKQKEPVYSYGTLVWAKFSKTWWPAIVVDGFLAKVNPPKNNNLWVMWFGDHMVSEVTRISVELFTRNFLQRSEGKHSGMFETAVTEALHICADRAKLDLPTYDSIRLWGRSETGFTALIHDDPELFTPDQDCAYPPMVFRALKKIADMHSARSDSSSDSDDTGEERRVIQGDRTEATTCNNMPIQQSVTEGNICQTGTLRVMIIGEERRAIQGDRNEATTCNNMPIQQSVTEGDFCLSCAKPGQTLVSQHPLFEGAMCAHCQDSVMETFFALDKDGCYLFCGICGEGGDLVMCEMPDCGRSYCLSCVKKYISYTTVKKLKDSSPWACFLCSPYQLESHGLLVPRQDWQEEVLRLFNPRSQVNPHMECLISVDNRPKRKLRVLSLFDGICTVKYVLEQLGLDIEVYYASEIDAPAELVAMFNHGFSVSQLGDIHKIERTTLQEICPIDLLVGSPPCDDLDISNKEYEGFNGGGVFMFKFLLILKDLEMLSGGNPVYWLLEATANMKSEYRHVLNSFFETTPALWDSQFFTAYLQPRYYWGNLPNMYSVFEYFKKLKVFLGTTDHVLDDYLVPNLNRKSMVSKLRPVALERRNDPDQQASGDRREETVNYCQPVLMDGTRSEIWVNEVEKVLGYPEHYTDVSQTSIPMRQKLLKQASSVHVLKHLLSPLTNIYAMK